MELFTTKNARVFVDDQYYPVIISHWYGQSDVPICEKFSKWHESQLARAVANGDKLVSISDSLHAVRPDALVRKYFAEWTKSLPSHYNDVTLKTMAVVGSAVLRGALVAIGWVSEEARRVTPISSLRDAIAEALETLDKHGIPRPAGLSPDTYVAPGDDEDLSRWG